MAAVCKKQCGAALLRTPDIAEAIVAAVRKAVNIPVFVKFRTGWEDRPEGAVAMARRFEAAGADALTFHPRVAPDRRTRPPKWAYIAEVKSSVKIPVFGNGDVFDRADCERMIATTGCDGIALWDINCEQFQPERWEVVRRLGHRDRVAHLAPYSYHPAGYSPEHFPRMPRRRVTALAGRDFSHLESRDTPGGPPRDKLSVYSGG